MFVGSDEGGGKDDPFLACGMLRSDEGHMLTMSV
jgi:hypothetical protein